MSDAPVPELSTIGRVLVTGGSGFIGRRLVARLTAGASAPPVVTTARPAAEVDVPGATVAQCDLRDPLAVDALIAAHRPQVVFHLASAVTGSRDRSAVRPTFELTLASTVALLDAVATHCPTARFVQAGSLEEPVDATPPSSPYAAAKAAASAYVRMYHGLYGLDATIARIFMVYGPGAQNEARLIPYVIRALLAGDTPALSSGTRAVDWVHVDDVVDGLVRLAAAPAAAVAGRTVDLGTGTCTTVRDVASMIGAIVAPHRPLAFGAVDDRPQEQERVADVAASRAALGWAPPTALTDGLAATVDWFRTH